MKSRESLSSSPEVRYSERSLLVLDLKGRELVHPRCKVFGESLAPVEFSAHGVSQSEESCLDVDMHSIGQRERRRSRRVQMKQALRVRSVDPKDGRFAEVGASKDVSQDGVYFVTERDGYYEGM